MMPENDVSIGKMRWMIFLLGRLKIPMIGYIKPKLLVLDDDSVMVKVKLRRRTRNHLGSMYFGALAVGADVAAGVHAFYFTKKMNRQVSFAFKAVKGDFIKRAESDVIFACKQGKLVEAAILKSIEESERVNQPIMIEVRDIQKELVAEFEMLISVRVK